MRTVERTGAFKKDYKRVKATPKHRNIDDKLEVVLLHLVTDNPLPKKYCDHSLSGEWKDYRDCHVKPDLVLIYRKPDHQIIQLVRLGSHSELGL
jgi:mRNA interferase YafQ